MSKSVVMEKDGQTANVINDAKNIGIWINNGYKIAKGQSHAVKPVLPKAAKAQDEDEDEETPAPKKKKKKS